MKIWTGEGRSRWQRCRHTAKNSSSQNSSEQVRALAVQCGDNSGSSEWVGRKIDCPSPVLPPARGFEFCWALKGLNVRVIWKAGLITGDKWGCLSSWEWKEEKAEKVKSWDPIVGVWEIVLVMAVFEGICSLLGWGRWRSWAEPGHQLWDLRYRFGPAASGEHGDKGEPLAGIMRCVTLIACNKVLVEFLLEIYVLSV